MDFTVELRDLDSKPITTEGSSSALTLGGVSSSALMQSYRDETPDGEEKVKRWRLALQIYTNKDVELTVEDIKRIKDCVAKCFGPLIVGQVWQAIDPASVK